MGEADGDQDRRTHQQETGTRVLYNVERDVEFLYRHVADQNNLTAITKHQPAPGSIVRTEFLKLLREDYEGEVDDIPLAELGIDSLDFFEKLLYLEEDLGIRNPIQEIDDKITLRELVDIAGG